MPVATYIPGLPSDLAEYGRIATVAKSGARHTSIQAAADAIGAGTAEAPHLIEFYPGIYDMGTALGGVALTIPDYCYLRGVDRDACIIRRLEAPQALAGVIQAPNHGGISNLTIRCPVTRHIHWDNGIVGAWLFMDRVTHDARGSYQVGFSSGIGSGQRVRLTNIEYDQSGFSAHSGPAGSAPGELDLHNILGRGPNDIAMIGLDYTGSQSPMIVRLSGISTPAEGGGPYSVVFEPPASPQWMTIENSDGSASFRRHPGYLGTPSPIFWSCIRGPRSMTAYAVSPGVLAGTLVVLTFVGENTVATTTTPDSPFPAVVAQPQGTFATNSPYLASGALASVAMKTAQAVVLGDIIVTSDTAGQGMVNNAQIDLTKILGWAISTKAGGVAGWVNLRLNKLVGF